MDVINTSGRRKTSVARIYLEKGKGNITVNNRDYKEYFPSPHLQQKLLLPFEVTETSGEFDVKVNVDGGGIKGQADAVKLAIAKALEKNDPDLRAKMKSDSLLTRDPRMVERKKPGRKKARKSTQFSKR